MLRINNLCKNIKGKALLKSVNINVEEGMIYGFIGHNGAGKTTTMRAIVGLTSYDEGEIIIDGVSYQKKVDINQVVGYLPQSPNFYDYMTGFEYINYLGRFRDNKQANILLERVGLAKAKKKRISSYSGGMRQRLGVAAAMIHSPKLLIMDEPTSALDPAGRYELFDMIKQLRNNGSTIILSTHILDDIERVSDRIGIIKDGEILKEDNVDQILLDYFHPIFDVSLRNDCPVNTDYFESINWIKGIEVNGNKLSITVKDVDVAREHILTTLAQSNLPVVGFQLRRPNLEDVFMKEIRL